VFSLLHVLCFSALCTYNISSVVFKKGGLLTVLPPPNYRLWASQSAKAGILEKDHRVCLAFPSQTLTKTTLIYFNVIPSTPARLDPSFQWSSLHVHRDTPLMCSTGHPNQWIAHAQQNPNRRLASWRVASQRFSKSHISKVDHNSKAHHKSRADHVHMQSRNFWCTGKFAGSDACI